MNQKYPPPLQMWTIFHLVSDFEMLTRTLICRLVYIFELALCVCTNKACGILFCIIAASNVKGTTVVVYPGCTYGTTSTCIHPYVVSTHAVKNALCTCISRINSKGDNHTDKQGR